MIELALALALARVQVAADDFSLALSRQKVTAGPALIELVNFGEDTHDLRLRREAPGARTFRIRAVRPGAKAGLELTLRPGRYHLWCSLADHRELGMEATLVVR